MKENKRGPYGKSMIKFTVKFWTSNLPQGTDKKTAWASGTIHLLKNELKGIKPRMTFFRNLEEFNSKLQKLIDDEGIRLVEVPKEKFRVRRLDKLDKKWEINE